MSTGIGDKSLGADIGAPGKYIYTRFVTVVKNGFLGDEGAGYPNIIWWLGNFPHDNFEGSLGDRNFPTPDPNNAPEAMGNKIFPPLTAIFDALYAYANTMTRVRMVQMTYQIDPAADDVQVGLTALNAGYLGAVVRPSTATLVTGQKISLAAIDAFMNQLKAELDANAAPLVAITMCHSSCHSSCHGARGRR